MHPSPFQASPVHSFLTVASTASATSIYCWACRLQSDLCGATGRGSLSTVRFVAPFLAVLSDCASALPTFVHFSTDVRVLQDILFGLFWLIWAECALLSHVFRYDSVSSMPLVPFLYVVLTPVLILGAFLTYLYPSHIKNLFISR